MTQEFVQIHRMRQVTTNRFIEDPETGGQRVQQVQRFMPDDTDRISHGDDVWEIQSDRSFYVPKDVAEHLLRLPDWHAGPNPFAPEPDDEEPAPRAAARKPAAKK